MQTCTKLVLQLLGKNHTKCRNYCKFIIQPQIMGEPNFTGKFLPEILERLEAYAPLSLAESWDNVGLLIDPMEAIPIKRILLTNDLTEDVLNEAVNVKANLIVSYHPNIFQGLKRVTSSTWKERIVVNCIKNNIAVFSPHTSWDTVVGGVNDWLANSFSTCSKIPIKRHLENELVGAGRICQLNNPMKLHEAVKAIKTQIGIPHLRLAIARHSTIDREISSVAVCAGSGTSVLKGVKADLYLTGEMLHHDVLEATQNGTHVILCNHSDSERGFLKHFQAKLQCDLKNLVEVLVSQTDHDPLRTV